MGLFNWFSKPQRFKKLDDRIWLNRHGRLAGIVDDVRQRRNANERVLVVAHFSDTLNDVFDTLKSADISCQIRQQPWETRDVADFAQQHPQEPLLTLARCLPEGTGEPPSHALDEFAPPIAVIVAERFPLPTGDERVERFVESLPGRGSLLFCYDLDEPLMRLFFGDWARDMLVRLGMEQDESIESRMVSRRVRDAQRRIQQTAYGDAESASAEEWFKRNLPPID